MQTAAPGVNKYMNLITHATMAGESLVDVLLLEPASPGWQPPLAPVALVAAAAAAATPAVRTEAHTPLLPLPA